MVDMVLNMAGRTSWNLYNVALSLGVQIGVDLLLIPKHGILGAAVGWSAGIVLANLVPLLQIGITAGLHPFGRSTLLTMTLTLICFGLVPWAATTLLGQGWGALVVSLTVGGTAYLAALWRFRGALHLVELVDVRRRKRRQGV
jgi:O-antigen/teichoic acid export membrane protein